MEEGGAGMHHHQLDYQLGTVTIFGEKASLKVKWSGCCWHRGRPYRLLFELQSWGPFSIVVERHVIF